MNKCTAIIGTDDRAFGLLFELLSLLASHSTMLQRKDRTKPVPSLIAYQLNCIKSTISDLI